MRRRLLAGCHMNKSGLADTYTLISFSFFTIHLVEMDSAIFLDPRKHTCICFAGDMPLTVSSNLIDYMTRVWDDKCLQSFV